jgi:QLQ
MLVSSSMVQESREQSVTAKHNHPVAFDRDVPLRANKNEISSMAHEEPEAPLSKRIALIDQNGCGQASTTVMPVEEDGGATTSWPTETKLLQESTSAQNRASSAKRPPYTSEQLDQLKHQIYAFKCLSKNLGVPVATQNLLFGDRRFK